MLENVEETSNSDKPILEVAYQCQICFSIRYIPNGFYTDGSFLPICGDCKAALRAMIKMHQEAKP